MYSDILNYCDSTADLTDNTWYFFSFGIDPTGPLLKCYLNGVSYSTGSNS